MRGNHSVTRQCPTVELDRTQELRNEPSDLVRGLRLMLGKAVLSCLRLLQEMTARELEMSRYA